MQEANGGEASQLPFELWEIIIGFLPLQEYRVIRVCKLWYRSFWTNKLGLSDAPASFMMFLPSSRTAYCCNWDKLETLVGAFNEISHVDSPERLADVLKIIQAKYEPNKPIHRQSQRLISAWMSFRAFDRDRDGGIGFGEFMDGMKILFAGDQSEREDFVNRMLDVDGDGIVTGTDLLEFARLELSHLAVHYQDLLKLLGSVEVMVNRFVLLNQKPGQDDSIDWKKLTLNPIADWSYLFGEWTRKMCYEGAAMVFIRTLCKFAPQEKVYMKKTGEEQKIDNVSFSITDGWCYTFESNSSLTALESELSADPLVVGQQENP